LRGGGKKKREKKGKESCYFAGKRKGKGGKGVKLLRIQSVHQGLPLGKKKGFVMGEKVGPLRQKWVATFRGLGRGKKRGKKILTHPSKKGGGGGLRP